MLDFEKNKKKIWGIALSVISCSSLVMSVIALNNSKPLHHAPHDMPPHQHHDMKMSEHHHDRKMPEQYHEEHDHHRNEPHFEHKGRSKDFPKSAAEENKQPNNEDQNIKQS